MLSHTIVFISHTSKVMLKVLQASLQQYVNRELPDIQAGFRKGERTRGQIANIYLINKKAREFQKNIYFCFIDYAKALDCVDHKICEKFFKRWEYQATLSASWEISMQVKKQELELDTEQQTGSKLGKEYVKAVCCLPVYLTYMQITSRESQAGWSTSWNQDCLRNINNHRYADDTTIMAESEEGLRSLLIKEENEKASLKLNIQKTKIMASVPITSWQIDGETMETVRDFFLDSIITANGDCSHEI